MTAVVAPPPPPPTTDDIFIRFPPWPAPPPGSNIIPFNDYAKREAGIKLTCPNGDGIEVDGFGIPTVTLEHRHVMDKCKTDAFREEKSVEDDVKIKKSKKKATAVSGDIKREWWEAWAEEEAGKFTGPYNPKTPAIDRLCQAATDFRGSRIWPQGEPRQLSPIKLFNQFGVFIGLQAIIPTWIRAERRKAEEALKEFKDMVEKSGQNGTHDDDDGDPLSDEDDHINAPSATAVELQDGKQDNIDLKNQDEDRTSAAEAAAIQEENERKDDRLLAFLNDPETIVKMFLSSYMRKEGLVWSDSNLIITPHLLFFFLRYILRNKLLPEYETGLKNALAVAERARVELPRTSVVAKIIPCEVALAFRDQYGSKAPQFKLTTVDDNEPEDGQWGNSNMDYIDDETDPALEEPTVEYVGEGEYVDAEQPIDQEGIAKIEEVGDETEGVEPIKSDPIHANNSYNGWDDKGWGDIPMDVDSSWGNAAAGVWDTQGNWNDASKFQPEDPPAIDWTLPVYSLKIFLGIDSLPASYATGVVEESVRKIISVHEPTGTAVADGHDDTMGGKFESKLARVVLAPWNDWDNPKEGKDLDEVRRVYSEIYRGRRIEKGIRKFDHIDGEEDAEDVKALDPEELYDEDDSREYSESSNANIVWESSTGWVVDPDATDNTNALLFSNCTADKPTPSMPGDASMLHVHDASKDTIQVLVDPAVADKLKDVIGMGLGGTFVQLVRNDATADLPDEGTKKYWYADKLALVIPSFYIA